MRHPSVYGAVGAHSGVYLLKADWSSAPLFGPEPGANRAFHARLDSLHSAIEFHVYPGSHDWSYCRTHPEQSLVAVPARMRAGEATRAGLAQP